MLKIHIPPLVFKEINYSQLSFSLQIDYKDQFDINYQKKYIQKFDRITTEVNQIFRHLETNFIILTIIIQLDNNLNKYIKTELMIKQFNTKFQHHYNDAYIQLTINLEQENDFKFKKCLMMNLCQVLPLNYSNIIFFQDQYKEFIFNQGLEIVKIPVIPPVIIIIYDKNFIIQYKLALDCIHIGFHNINIDMLKLFLSFSKYLLHDIQNTKYKLNLKYKQFGINSLQIETIINKTTIVNDKYIIQLKPNNSFITCNQQYYQTLIDINYVYDGQVFIPFSDYNPEEYSFIGYDTQNQQQFNISTLKESIKQSQDPQKEILIDSYSIHKKINKQLLSPISINKQERSIFQQSEMDFVQINSTVRQSTPQLFQDLQQNTRSKSNNLEQGKIQKKPQMSGTDSLSEKQSYIIKQKQLKQQFTFIPQVKYKSEMQKIINLSPEISFKQKYELMLENQKQQRLIRLQQLQKTIQQTQYQLQQGGLQLSGTKLDQQIEQHELVQQDRDQLLQRITMSQYKVEQLKRDEIEQIRQQFYQNLYDEKETSYINLNNNKKLQ